MKPQISKLFTTTASAALVAALAIFQPFITPKARAAQDIYITAATLEAQPEVALSRSVTAPARLQNRA